MVDMTKYKVKRPGMTQNVLIIFNMILFFAGIALVTIGFAAREPKLFVKYLRMAFQRAGIKFPREITNIIAIIVKNGGGSVAVAAIITGGIISVVSFAGCMGACCSQKLLKFYQFALLVLICIICMGNRAIHNSMDDTTEILAREMTKFFKFYDKPLPKKIVDALQHEGKCCGIFGPDSWKENEAFTNKIKDLKYAGQYPVPMSCCLQPRAGCGLSNNKTYIQDNEDLSMHLDGTGLEAWDQHQDKWDNEVGNEWDDKDSGMSKDDWEGSGNGMDNDSGNDFDDDERYDFKDVDYTTYINYTSSANYTYGSGYYDGSGDYYGSGSNSTYRLITGNHDQMGGVTGWFRFVQSVSAEDFKEDQKIFHQGCALKFSDKVHKFRRNIDWYTFYLCLPEIICILMAQKVKTYQKKKREMEEQKKEDKREAKNKA